VQGIAKLKEIGDQSEFATMDPDDIPFAVDDSVITTVIDGSDFTQAKFDALTAHKTQVSTDGGFFALSNNLGLEIFTEEHYRLVRGELPQSGQESDLFEGLTLV